jgi:hypothetical protein
MARFNTIAGRLAVKVIQSIDRRRPSTSVITLALTAHSRDPKVVLLSLDPVNGDAQLLRAKGGPTDIECPAHCRPDCATTVPGVVRRR